MNRTAAQRAYLAVNAILAGVILLIMGYSAFFSPDGDAYPIACIHEKITGEPCPSCGLSHAFSLIIRGRVDEALQWNNTSLRVFLFFAIQLVMRIALSVRSLLTGFRINRIIVYDSLISAAMAFYAFFPFLRALWMALF